MRSYVSPIGYNSTSVVRPVLSRGLDSGDEVHLVRPSTGADENRAEEAIADVERLVTEIEPTVDLSVHRLAHDDFETSVLSCSELLTSLEGAVVICLGGGARDVLLPLTTAALANVDVIHETLTFSDVDGSVRDVELPMIRGDIPEAIEPTFVAIAEANGEMSISSIVDATDLSKSSVTRHIQRLERANLVRSETRGKSKFVELTFSGKLQRAIRPGEGDG